MRPAAVRRSRGFSVFELTIGIGILGLIATGTTSMLGTTHGLAAETRSALRAEQECLRNLNAVKNVLRTAAWTSLSGFTSSSATAPAFQRVVGVDSVTGPVLGGVESIEWRSSGESVRGVASPGNLVLVSGGTETVLARRVPSGGLQVVREGYLLRIRITTYAVADGTTTTVLRESAVSVRN